MPESVGGWSAELSERFPVHYETIRGKVRQALVSRQLGEHLNHPPAQICDVGGGVGHQAIPLAWLGYEATILDPSAEMLEKTRSALASEDESMRGQVRLVHGAGEDAPRILEGESLDAVLCHGVLTHLEDTEPLVRAVAEISHPGGIISILTGNADALAMRPAHEGRYGDALAAFDAIGMAAALALRREDTRFRGFPGCSKRMGSRFSAVRGQGVHRPSR